jgi:hypothetical protein
VWHKLVVSVKSERQQVIMGSVDLSLNFVWGKAIPSNTSAASIPNIHKPHCQLDLVLGRYSSFNLSIRTEQSEIVAAPYRYVQRDYLPGFHTVTISIDEKIYISCWILRKQGRCQSHIWNQFELEM